MYRQVSAQPALLFSMLVSAAFGVCHGEGGQEEEEEEEKVEFLVKPVSKQSRVLTIKQPLLPHTLRS